jgi:hypothetical protein
VEGVLALWEGRADKALGYTGRNSWVEYCNAEFGTLPRITVPQRRELSRRLTEEGMSQRQSGAVLGVRQGTVLNDLRDVSEQNCSDTDALPEPFPENSGVVPSMTQMVGNMAAVGEGLDVQFRSIWRICAR